MAYPPRESFSLGVTTADLQPPADGLDYAAIANSLTPEESDYLGTIDPSALDDPTHQDNPLFQSIVSKLQAPPVATPPTPAPEPPPDPRVPRGGALDLVRALQLDHPHTWTGEPLTPPDPLPLRENPNASRMPQPDGSMLWNTALGVMGMPAAAMGAASGALIDQPGDLGHAAQAALGETLRLGRGMPATTIGAPDAPTGTTMSAEAKQRGVDFGPVASAVGDFLGDPLNFGNPALDAVKFGVAAKGLTAAGLAALKSGALAHAAVMLPNFTKALKDAAEARGLYSRVEDVARTVSGKGMHPNKVLSMLRSGASAEELAYRKIPEFLAAKGNTPVTQAELAAHLAAHPAPRPTVKTLSATLPESLSTYFTERRTTAPTTPNGWTYLSDELTRQAQRLQREGSRELSQRYFGLAEDATSMAEGLDLGTGATAGQPKYASYQLPGGTDYRERLFTLPETRQFDPSKVTLQRLRQSTTQGSVEVFYDGQSLGKWDDPHTLNPHTKQYEARTDAELIDLVRKRYAGSKELGIKPLDEGASFRSSHFDEPNIVVHTRSNNRTLPVQGLRPLSEIEALIMQAVPKAKTPASLASGAPGLAVEKGLITEAEAQLYGHAKGFTNYPEPPTGSPGHFIEEVQSDWHQQGKKQGYATPLTADQQRHLAYLDTAITDAKDQMHALDKDYQAAHAQYLDAMQAATIQRLPPEYADLSSFSEATQEGEEAVAAWRAARDPFHGTPEARTLKAAETQAYADREAAINQVNALLQEQKDLHKPAGVPDAPFKETWPDLALKQHLLDAAADPQAEWLGFTSGATQADRYDLSKQIESIDYRRKPDGWYELGAVDVHGDGVHGLTGLYQEHELADVVGKDIAEKIVAGEGRPGGGRMTLRGLDLQVGGEGMKHFYDQLLPKRLEKLVKPFGGTVERSSLTGGRTKAAIDAEMDALTDATPIVTPKYREAMARLQAERDAAPAGDGSAWIVHLTPEMKAKIVKQGLPLMGIAGLTAAQDPEDRNWAATAGMAAAVPFLGGEGLRGAAAAVRAERMAAAAAKLAEGTRAARAAVESVEATAGAKRFAGLPLPGKRVGTLAKSIEYAPEAAAMADTGRVWVPEGDTWAGTGLYKVKPVVMPRLDVLTRMGVTEGINWAGGIDELRHAFGGDEQEMVRWARSWGAMSPATNALDSTRESVGALLWQLEHPGEKLTKEIAGNLEGNFTVKNRGSKLPNYERARADLPLSGDKAEAMSGYMAGQDRRPLDVHAIYGITGSADPNLSFTNETKALRELMTKAEGLKARNPGGLTDRQLYLRYEDALRRGLAEVDPRSNGNAIFGDFWEGVRLHKGLPKQGGPIDMLRKQGLLGFGAMLNPDELRRALRQSGWTKLAVGGLLAAISADVVARRASASETSDAPGE